MQWKRYKLDWKTREITKKLILQKDVAELNTIKVMTGLQKECKESDRVLRVFLRVEFLHAIQPLLEQVQRGVLPDGPWMEQDQIAGAMNSSPCELQRRRGPK